MQKAAACVALFLGLVATAQSPPSTSRRSEVVDWARAGEPLVLRVEPTEEQRRSGSIPARLSRGDALYAPLWWIGPIERADPVISRVPSELTAGTALVSARGAAWMNELSQWVAIAATDTARRSLISAEGNWYVVIDLPPDSAGLDVTLDGRRVPLGWIPKSVTTTTPWHAPPPPGGWLAAALDSARRSPPDRWRARMAAGEPPVAAGPAADEFSDTPVECLADHIGAKWAFALHHVEREDGPLAQRVRTRLSLFADFGGVLAPVWPVEDGSLQQLQSRLLSAERSAATIAREWLDVQPDTACWIANDAVVYEPATDRIVSRISAMRLDESEGPVALMVMLGAGAAPAEVVPLRPLVQSSGLFALEGRDNTTTSITAHVGGWVARRAVLPRPIAAQPPGASIGPLFEDWNLPSWLASCTDAGSARTGPSPAGLGRPVAAPDRGAAGLLLAEAPTATGAVTGGQLQWTLYMECRTGPANSTNLPRTSDPAHRDELVLALAGAGGEEMMRVFPDGQVVMSGGSTARARTVRESNTWKVWVPLPAAVLGEGGWIRLGIARLDPSGDRASWPRPMFPWEERPAQAVIDLRPWSGLGGGAAPGR